MTDIQPGDLVEHINGCTQKPYEVLAVSDGQLWLRNQIPGSTHPVVPAANWRKIPPKWEIGKVYRQKMDIHDAPETVTALDEDGNALVWYQDGSERFYTARRADVRSSYLEVSS